MILLHGIIHRIRLSEDLRSVTTPWGSAPKQGYTVKQFDPLFENTDDTDPEETQDWLDSLASVIRHAGPERARFLMGTLDEATLAAQMAAADAFVVMKLGRTLDKVRNALRSCGRYEAAWLIEYAAMPDQTVQKLSETEGRPAPYFSIVVVHGNGRRP